jgi:hypothetical protein
MTVSEMIISISAFIIALLILILVVDWRYFRDWIVVFLFKCNLDFIWGSPVVNLKMLEYPVRFFSVYYETSILFELWVFPILCILYNQVTRNRGIGPILYYAVIFSAGITAIEYPIERYTDLIRYLDWSWFTTFYTLIITFLLSRMFIAIFRFGCDYYDKRNRADDVHK